MQHNNDRLISKDSEDIDSESNKQLPFLTTQCHLMPPRHRTLH